MVIFFFQIRGGYQIWSLLFFVINSGIFANLNINPDTVPILGVLFRFSLILAKQA